MDIVAELASNLKDNASIGGWLDLRDTDITSLPDTLKCKNVYCNEGQLDDHSIIMTQLKEISLTQNRTI